jgi:Zn-dependent protease
MSSSRADTFAQVVGFILGASVPVTCLHELGHALVAQRRLGGEVAISVGTAGKVAELRLAQIKVSVNALFDPARAGGYATFDAQRATARDVLAIALAGPLVSLIGTVVTAWLLSEAPSSGALHDLLWALTFNGASFAVFNLVPFKVQGRGKARPTYSDGLLALDALRLMRGA